MKFAALILVASLAWAQSPEIQRLLDESRTEMRQQHFDASIDLARQAIEKSENAGDKRALALSWIRLDLDFFYARRLPEAVDAAKHAQAAAKEAGDTSDYAGALGNEADAQRDQGNLEAARELYEKQLVYIRASGDRRAEMLHQLMTAMLYRRIGDKKREIANAENALHLARELNDRNQEAQCLFVLGAMEREQTMDAPAIEHLNAALRMPETTDQARIQILQSLGSAYCDLKQYSRCTETMKQQLGLADASGVPNQIAWGHNKVAFAEALMGAHAGAYKDALESVRVIRSAEHDPYDEAVFLSQVGRELVALGRVREAVVYFEQGIELIEQLRQGLIPSEQALATAASAAETKELFDETVDAQFGIDPAQAFHTHELARARAFLSILADSKVDLRQGLSESDRAREAALLSRIADIRKRLSEPGRASAAARQEDAELEQAESDLESFRLDMRKANPRLAGIQYPSPLTVDQARPLLKPGVTLIEYSLGEKRSFVWVLSRDRFASAELPAGRTIESQIDRFRALLTSRVSGLTVRQSEAETGSLAARLYGTLLQPVEAEFTQSRELIVVPDGALHYLPFEALLHSGRYLLERFPLSYVASATSFLAVGAEPAGSTQTGSTQTRQLLAFGDPLYGKGESPLPYTRAEVNAIAGLFPSGDRSVYLGDKANEQSLRGEKLGEYRYIHFATHGQLDEAHPARSGLALTPEKDDGVLRVDAITALRLHAEVVTLSACNTGLGDLVSGEGVLGLVRAFLYAGAGSVNVSLWNVNDAATAELMKAFYRNLSRSVPPDQALRNAKLALLHQENALWRHPHFWAPFVLWLR